MMGYADEIKAQDEEIASREATYLAAAKTHKALVYLDEDADINVKTLRKLMRLPEAA
jgi:hypothetical protein